MADFSAIISKLEKANISFTQNEPLKKHTSFKIGGKAAVFCVPKTIEEIAFIRDICKNTKTFILGKGSNVLFTDNPYEGVIINLVDNFSQLEVIDNCINAYAGADLAQVCKTARDNSLTGMEFAYGIPGCVGGAVFMNAGAYDGEIKDIVQEIVYLDDNNRQCTLQASDANFAYRDSVFQHNNFCIISAKFKLQKGDKLQIENKMQDFAKRRAEKQPLDLPSAGSAFKRPVGAFAGALIDECGLRGKQMGGAAISQKHCGFIVNNGDATCEDVLALANEVCRTVYEKTGYNLEKEIRVIE